MSSKKWHFFLCVCWVGECLNTKMTGLCKKPMTFEPIIRSLDLSGFGSSEQLPCATSIFFISKLPSSFFLKKLSNEEAFCIFIMFQSARGSFVGSFLP